jgi:diguanylate cyclase (GGDEF)-like protein
MSALQSFAPTSPVIHGRKLRVLMAEAEPLRISRMLRSLFPDEESSLQLTTVSTISILLPTIQLVGPEVLFLDLSASGPDPLATVRAVHRASPSLPLIAVADSSDKPTAQQSLREGAFDFLLKDVADEKTLERVLRTALERNTVSSLVDLLRDSSTELYNADGFRALAVKYVKEAQRSGGQLVLLSVSIENIEALNREFGPSNAESAIKETAELLRRSFRRTDLVARLQGANFAILAADAAEPSVAIIRQRLESRREALNRAREPWGVIELSVNVAFWSARHEKPFAEVAEELLAASVPHDLATAAAGESYESSKETE